MKFTSFLFTAFFLFFSISAFSQNPAPELVLKKLKGQTVNLKDYASNGKITAVSFWATWCTPCKKELDAISEVYEDWKDEFGDFELLAITIDNARQLTKVPGIASTKGWEFEVLSVDQNAAEQALNFQTIPQTFLIDQEGNIVYSHSGYVPGDEFELEDHIREIAK